MFLFLVSMWRRMHWQFKKEIKCGNTMRRVTLKIPPGYNHGIAACVTPWAVVLAVKAPHVVCVTAAKLCYRQHTPMRAVLNLFMDTESWIPYISDVPCHMLLSPPTHHPQTCGDVKNILSLSTLEEEGAGQFWPTGHRLLTPELPHEAKEWRDVKYSIL